MSDGSNIQDIHRDFWVELGIRKVGGFTMKSYHLLRGSLRNSVLEFRHALRQSSPEANDPWAQEVVRRRDCALAQIKAKYGVEWKGKQLLEVGCGQLCIWSLVFGQWNTVTAFDIDIVPERGDLGAYWRLARTNGGFRLAKTIVRKALGVDQAKRKSLEKAAGQALPWPTVHCMDAQRIEFPSEMFDGVYSFAVFEHIEDPRQAMREIYRVLRPGGVAYIALELFTSLNGAHDPALWDDRAYSHVPWAHLRPSYRGRCRSNVYVNRVRLEAYKEMARDTFDEAEFVSAERGQRQFLLTLTPEERRELSEYSDEELCTQDLIILARKKA